MILLGLSPSIASFFPAPFQSAPDSDHRRLRKSRHGHHPMLHSCCHRNQEESLLNVYIVVAVIHRIEIQD